MHLPQDALKTAHLNDVSHGGKNIHDLSNASRSRRSGKWYDYALCRVVPRSPMWPTIKNKEIEERCRLWPLGGVGGSCFVSLRPGPGFLLRAQSIPENGMATVVPRGITRSCAHLSVPGTFPGAVCQLKSICEHRLSPVNRNYNYILRFLLTKEDIR